MTKDKADKKLYSQRSFYIATYIGGPLVAGYLAQQNFKALGKRKYGDYSIIIGIISSILLFAFIFSIPEPIIDKVPRFLIPAAYTLIIALLIEKFQGRDLKQHQENEGTFYSAWRAAGFGFISLFILSIGIVSYIYFGPQDFDVDKYDSQIAVFNKNEEKALDLFKIIDIENPTNAIEYIDQIAIPLWKENIKIVKDLNQLDGLTEQFIMQNKALLKYCELRIQSLNLIKLALKGNTSSYDSQIEKLNREIESVLSKLE